MPWFDFIWTPENIAHIEEHGLSTDEVESVIMDFDLTGISHSSDRPFAIGETFTGKQIFVAFEMIDSVTAYPITAYEVER